MSDEIDAFFAGVTTWDIIIMVLIVLVLWKIFKKIFFIVLLVAIGYYFYQTYGK